MPSSPQVSVVMPAHNSAAFIAEAIESVLAQRSVSLELIVIDDGSKDESAAIAQGYSDPRVVLLQNASAGGPSRARNQGIRAARAPYIAFLDSDDVMSADSMQGAVDALDASPEAVIAFGDLRRIDPAGHVTVPSVLAGYPAFRQVPKSTLADGWSLIRREDFARGLLHENFIGTGSVVFRVAALRGEQPFDETLFNSEDRDLWFRLARRGDALYSNRITYSYRINPNSISHDRGDRNALNRIEVLRRERKRWSTSDALKQIDWLIADNLASVGYARRAQGRPLAAAASFASACVTAPSWAHFRGFVGSLLGRT